MQLSLLTVVPMILVLASASAESHLRGLQTKKCSGSGSGGDCSNTPTYCGSSGNAVSCRYEPPHRGEITNVCKDMCLAEFRENPNDGIGGVPGSGRYTCNEEEMNNHPNYCTYLSCNRDCPDNIVTPIPVEYSDEARTSYDKRCSKEVENDFPLWCNSNYMGRFGGYRGSCSGTNTCLNLDFHCAEGEYCEMRCAGRNSCEGLTMHCADNQFCTLRCSGSGCVNAEVRCGEGMVFNNNNNSCVPAIQPLTKAPQPETASPTFNPTKNAPTKAPTSAPSANDDGSETAVTWKKYDATDCKGAHTKIDGSKFYGGSQKEWQTKYTVDEMLAECKSKCANNEACVAFNFRDNREHPDYTFGGSYCQFWSTITSTPDAVGDSKDCWVSSKANYA